jgi:hypothetical protein
MSNELIFFFLVYIGAFQVEMGGFKALSQPSSVSHLCPHDQECYLSIDLERLGSTISFAELI